MNFSKNGLRPWELVLIDKYPLIFTENVDDKRSKYYRAPAENFVSLRSGFEHDVGWAGLVEKIAKTGTELVEHLRSGGHASATISSCICKEKFGVLRWQGDFNLPEPFTTLWYSFVSDIESKSQSTCEITGEYGTLCRSEHGWLKTLSAAKAKEMGYVDYEDYRESKNKTSETTE